ncbi:MAG: cell division protein FtsQ/DivIB [Leptospirales bacterium]
MSKALSGPAPGAEPAFRKKWQGKGRLILTILFFCGMAILSLHPGQKVRSEPSPLILIGPHVITKKTVRSWLGADPGRDFYRPEEAGVWLGHHPWVERISFKRFLWGSGAVIVKIKMPIAFLSASSSETPGNPSVPWVKRGLLPYLLPDGKVVNGLATNRTDRLPQVIVRSPLNAGARNTVVSAIRLVGSCMGHGAPSGHVYVYRGQHDVRFFPERRTGYLILPEEGHCGPFRLYERMLAHSQALPKGIVPQGYDLRFEGMLLILPESTAGMDSGLSAPLSVSP